MIPPLKKLGQKDGRFIVSLGCRVNLKASLQLHRERCFTYSEEEEWGCGYRDVKGRLDG